MIGISEGIVLANRYQLVRRQFERGIGAGWVAVDAETSAEVWVQFTRHGGLEAVGELLRRHGHAGMPAVLDTGELRMIVDSSALALRAEGDSHSTHVEIVIEFVVCRPITGRAMTAKVARKPLTPAEALLAVAGLAEALELALGEGYSHGWLTGESVWITRRGACALDLALGLCASDEMIIEVEQEVTGCFGPERLSGGPATEAADVFALGWLLYSLLIGYAGLQIEYARVVAEAGAATTLELLARWRKRARRHIIELLGADSALAALLVAALAENAADRPTLAAFHPGARAAAGDLAGVAALVIPLPAAHARNLGPAGVAAVGAGVVGAAAVGAAIGLEATGLGAEGESISGAGAGGEAAGAGGTGGAGAGAGGAGVADVGAGEAATGATEGTETVSGAEAGGEAAGGSGAAGVAAAGAAGALVGLAAGSAAGGAGSGAAGAGGVGAAGASGAGGAGGAATGSGGAAGGAGSAAGGVGGAGGGSGAGAGGSGAGAGAVGAAGGASAGYVASSLGQVGLAGSGTSASGTSASGASASGASASETAASESVASESELSESARRWRRKVLASSAASGAAVLVVGIVIGYLWGHNSSSSTVMVAATPATVVVTVTVTVPGLNSAGTPTSALVVGAATTPTASAAAGSGATPSASPGGGSGGGSTPAAGAFPAPTSDTQALSQMSQAVHSAGSAGQITSSTESTFQNSISSVQSESKGSTAWWTKVRALGALIQSSQQQGTIPTGLANQLTGIVNYLYAGGGS